MPFDTHYPNRKDRRRPYRGAKSFDRSCRNHGGCPYCLANRRHADAKREQAARDRVVEAAIAWGKAPVPGDDEESRVESLAADLELCMALDELDVPAPAASPADEREGR